MDDIPMAQRDGLSVASSPEAASSWAIFPTRRSWKFLGGVAIGMAIALGLASLLAWRSGQPATSVATPSPSPVVAADLTPPPMTDGLLGHLPYAEAPANSLKAITQDGEVKLRTAAADRFTAMIQAARAERVILVPLSGFRSLDDQTEIFFERKAEMGQRPVERASVSAPPGYSEHHTGYAIDIGDGTRSETNLELTFESTPAFRWLEANAARYSFELSFPRDNSQGVSYEPWHWRFVGDRNSLETFYKAHQIRPSAPAPQPSPAAP
nr:MULTISPECIES: M15 family metallopeptidase [unclassified Leptolyngbya]